MLNQLRGVFSCLHRHRVKYITIGGIAAILHGVPRATFDLDIVIEAIPFRNALFRAPRNDSGAVATDNSMICPPVTAITAPASPPPPHDLAQATQRDHLLREVRAGVQGVNETEEVGGQRSGRK